MQRYKVFGMSCAACQKTIENAVSKVKGVDKCNVSLLTSSMLVEGRAASESIIRAVQKAGYRAEILDGGKSSSEGKNNIFLDEIKQLKKRLIASFAFLFILMYITIGHNMLSFPLPSIFAHNYVGLALVQMLLTIAVLIIN